MFAFNLCQGKLLHFELNLYFYEKSFNMAVIGMGGRVAVRDDALFLKNGGFHSEVDAVF